MYIASYSSQCSLMISLSVVNREVLSWPRMRRVLRIERLVHFSQQLRVGEHLVRGSQQARDFGESQERTIESRQNE